MTARLPFTELSVRRAIRAARAEGMRVSGFTIRPDGTLTVHDTDAAVAGSPMLAQHGASSEFEDFKAALDRPGGGDVIINFGPPDGPRPGRR